MIDLDVVQPEPHARAVPKTWLAQVRANLALCWRQLLGVETIIVLCATVPALLWLPLYLVPSWINPWAIGVHIATMVFGSLFTAWAWSASLTILERARAGEPTGTWKALRTGLRGTGRLCAWLIALKVLTLPQLLIYLDLPASFAYMRSPLPTLVEGLGWYVAFATALLPIAILLEHRGVLRTLQLAHTRWATTMRIIAVLALGFATDSVVDALTTSPADALVSTAIAIPSSVISTVAYYTTYMIHTDQQVGRED